MADLSKQAQTALARYWSEILAGANQGLNTTQLYNNIRNRASELGLGSVGVGVGAISTLRKYASSMIRASSVFGASTVDQAITSSMISEAPWSRPLSEQNAMPVYSVQFLHTIQDESGNMQSVYQTIKIPGVLPPTVGALTDYVASEAQRMASEGGAITSTSPKGTSISVSGLSIMAI